MKKTIFHIFLSLFLFSVFTSYAAAIEAGRPAAPVMPQDPNKISLDIKGMDIVDALKMLSGRARMNIIVGKNVSGRVTLFLKEVDVWDAFEIILSANDLAYEKKGDIINIMTQRDYELLYGARYKERKSFRNIQLKYAKAADAARSLTQMKTNLGKVVVDEASNTLALIDSPEKIAEMANFIKEIDLPVQTRVFNLNYTQADKLSPKLQDAITKGIGSIKTDERTNKIAITDYPQKLDEIAKVIDAFDEKTMQVLIDAQIIELKPSNRFQMGINWDFWIEKYFELKTSLPINTDNTLFLGTTTASPNRKGQYKAIVDILRTIGDTKILSSPRIIALNNQEAKILVGTKDAYITSTTSQGATSTTVTSQTVNFVDVGIKLFVTPTINRDGFVTMKIKPEISSATRTNITSENQVTQVPIVTTSESETTVMVKDGVTIIMGGLRKDSREKTTKKIPLLGSIPILGNLFKSTDDNITKTELVILLTPHIISGENPYTDASDVHPKDGVVFKMHEGELVKDIYSSPAKKASQRLAQAMPDYCLSLNQKITKFGKFGAPGDRTGKVSLSFLVSCDGELIGEPKVLNATDQYLAPFAISAVKAASPFGPFPEDSNKLQQRFAVTIDYGR